MQGCQWVVTSVVTRTTLGLSPEQLYWDWGYAEKFELAWCESIHKKAMCTLAKMSVMTVMTVWVFSLNAHDAIPTRAIAYGLQGFKSSYVVPLTGICIDSIAKMCIIQCSPPPRSPYMHFVPMLIILVRAIVFCFLLLYCFGAPSHAYPIWSSFRFSYFLLDNG